MPLFSSTFFARLRSFKLYRVPIYLATCANAVLRFFRIDLYVGSKAVWDYNNGKDCYERLASKPVNVNTVPKIGFLISSVPMLYHYLPIVKSLPAELSVFIPVHSHYKAVKKLLRALSQHGCNVMTVRELLLSGQRLKVLLSNSAPMGASPTHKQIYDKYLSDAEQGDALRMIGKTQIRIMYGGGKIDWNAAGWNVVYDYIFVHGPYYEDLFLNKFPNVKVVQFGYPRLDDYFTMRESRHAHIERLGLDPNKPVVSILPTHGLPSCFDRIPHILPELREYNVIIKTHFLIDVCQEDFPEPNVLVISPDEDNCICYAVSDFVICDNGGSVLVSLYCDKNLLLFDKNYAAEDSPENLVRKEIPPFKEESLLETLRSKEHWENQVAVRQKLRDKFFKVDPQSGKFAANKLMEIFEAS